MDMCENEYTPEAEGYEAGISETAVTEPQIPEVISPEPPKTTQKRWGWKVTGICVLLAAACGITALLVSKVWEGKFVRMELAIKDRFSALEQSYSQKHNQSVAPDTQLPEQGPMPPSQIYAENVQAVVGINATYGNTDLLGGSAGSGFIISADGYVVTNHHVIENTSKVKVVMSDGKTLDAEIVGKDAANDVALLKVTGEKLPFVKIGSSDAMAVGDMVVAIGNPLGELNSTLTVGYVSGKDRIVSTDGSVINMLQTDAAINSGNSGGPLFNTKGEVIGITTAKYSGDSGSGAAIESLGFAIPMDDVERIISDLKEYGYVTGAYMGVSVRSVDAVGQSYGLPAGAYVVEVVKDGAADKAGIRSGDIIVTLGGYDVDSLATLTRVLRRFEAGQTVSVIVYRNGQNETLSITMDEKPAE